MLGVSGGPDSVAMVYILLGLQNLLKVSKYSVLHVNHGIRPESNYEEEFVIKAMKEAGIDNVIIERVDVLSTCKQRKLSIEMGARICRHEALENTRKRLGAHKIALAHQNNDQAEELILRLFRGASFESLEGMRPLEKEKKIIRPLLCLSRNEILSYLRDNKISYVEDSSNLIPCFQRNRVRLELLPLAESIFKKPVVKVLNRFTDIAARENDYWEEEVIKCRKEVCLEEGDGRIVLEVDKFRSLHLALQRRFVRDIFQRILGSCYGIYYDQIEALRRLIVEGLSGRYREIRGVRWSREGDRVIIEKKSYKNRETGNGASKPAIGMESSGFRKDRFQILDVISVPGMWTGTSYNIPLVIETRIYSRKDLDIDNIIKMAGRSSILYEPLLELVSTPGYIEEFVTANRREDPDYIALMDYRLLKKPVFIRNWRYGDRFQPLGMKGRSKKLQDYFVDLKIPRSLRDFVLLISDRDKICCIVGYGIDERVKITDSTEMVLEIKARRLTDTRSE